MWFKAEDRFYIKDKGWVYTGDNPYRHVIYKNKNWCEKYFLNKDWIISHPTLSKEYIYTVLGVESYATMHIRPKQPIGLLIKERQKCGS